MMITLPLRLLRLPVRSRLALALGVLVASLGLYELVGPSPLLGGGLLLPLILFTWLFGWQGGLLCLTSITLLLAASYEISSWGTFQPSAWLVPFLIGTGYRLVVCLMVGGLRHLTIALMHTQETMARIEQAYQQERARNERKGQALQNLRHELRTPLTQIQGYLDLLGTFQKQCDATTRARFIAVAQSGCEELLSVIETNMATAQAPTKQSPQLSIFPLKHEFQSVLAAFGPEFLRNHPVKLEMAESVLVRAEPHFVRQVMRNLLTNVDKYTPPATGVTVTAAPISAAHEPQGRADMICVRVKDQGPGIPPEQLPLLFCRGVRLPQTPECTQSGSGLGLAICKQLVEAMGGTMWVESTGIVGEGCCFCFTLARGAAPDSDELVKRNRELSPVD
jgi:signal transduction histidine kinase